MKFLVDAQLPPGLCAWLGERGHIAFHVQELGDEPLTDARIAAYLEGEQAVLMSKDEDFITLRLPDRLRSCGCDAATSATPDSGNGSMGIGYPWSGGWKRAPASSRCDNERTVSGKHLH